MKSILLEEIFTWWIQGLFLCPKLCFISEVSGSLEYRSKFYDKITSKYRRANSTHRDFMFSHPSMSTDSRKSSCWLRLYLIITFLSLLYYLECSSFETCNVLGISYSPLQLPGTTPSIFSLHAIFLNPTFQLSRLRHTLFLSIPWISHMELARKCVLTCHPLHIVIQDEKTFSLDIFPIYPECLKTLQKVK